MYIHYVTSPFMPYYIVDKNLLFAYCNVKLSTAPYFNMDEELAAMKTMQQAIAQKVIGSAHNVADGSLYFALLKSAIP